MKTNLGASVPILFVLLVIGVSGCVEPEMIVDFRTIEDEGHVCLTQDGELEVEVFFNACLSGSCDSVDESGCEIAVDGETITVSSWLTIKTEYEAGQGCTADCGVVSTTCTADALDAGEYELQHGQGSMTVTIPGEGEICGAGESPIHAPE